jgi:multiple sugar transport system permease protein
MMFSLIGSFAGFTLVALLTNGGPLGATQVLGTLSFLVGIMGGNLPLGAAIALFMVPILAVAATLILRGIAKRGSEV